MTFDEQLKLAALDAQDLSVLSAHVQDAVFKPSDVRWDAAAAKLVVGMNRFAWERARDGRRTHGRPANERRRSALQFDRVRKVSARGIVQGDDAVLSLLAMLFEPSDPPGGVVHLVCSGEAALRLDVECIEARLTDLGAAWQAASRPKHRLR